MGNSAQARPSNPVPGPGTGEYWLHASFLLSRYKCFAQRVPPELGLKSNSDFTTAPNFRLPPNAANTLQENKFVKINVMQLGDCNVSELRILVSVCRMEKVKVGITSFTPQIDTWYEALLASVDVGWTCKYWNSNEGHADLFDVAANAKITCPPIGSFARGIHHLHLSHIACI